jgi:hypothetical protein
MANLKDLNLTVKLKRIRLNEGKKQTLAFSVLLVVLGVIIAFSDCALLENMHSRWTSADYVTT